MTDQRKPGPGATGDIHNAPTQPAQRVPDGYRQREREVSVRTKEQEKLLALQTEHPGAPAWGLQVLVKVGSVEETLDDHGERIGTLEKLVVPRAKVVSLYDLEETDVESRGSMSADQRLQSIERATIRQRKDTRRATNTQTGVIVAGLLALGAAATQFISAQAERTRTETAQLQRQLAHDAAEAAAKAAADAAKKGTP